MRSLKWTLALLFFALLTFGGVGHVGDAPRPAFAQDADAELYPVHIGDQVAFRLGPSGDETAKQRAGGAERALKQGFESASPDDVRVERVGDAAILYLAKTPVAQLTAEDARRAGAASLEVYADELAASTRRAMKAERDRSALANRIFSVSLAVLLAVGVLYLRRRVSELSDRTAHWIEDNPHRIPAVRVRSLTLLTPAALRSGLGLALSLVTWVVQILLIYLWLISTLSFFEETKPYTERLNAIILQPFVDLAGRLAATLPISIVVAIALLVVAILFRGVELFFDSVRDGTTELEWLPPELARPTSTLLRASLVLTALVFAAPILTGQPDGALARVGLFAVLAVGRSTVPLLACAVVGLVIVYSRRYALGDHVRIADRRGRVADVGLLDLTVETSEGAELRFSHLMSLFRLSENFGPCPRVSCKMVVAALDEPLRARLLEIAGAVGQDPRIEVIELGTSALTVRLSVTSEGLDTETLLCEAASVVLSDPKYRDAP